MPDALFSLVVDFIEESDAVRTSFTSVGLCNMPLTGPLIPELPLVRPFRPPSPEVISADGGTTLGVVDTLLMPDQRCSLGTGRGLIPDEESADLCGPCEGETNRRNRLALSLGAARFLDIMIFMGFLALDLFRRCFEKSAGA